MYDPRWTGLVNSTHWGDLAMDIVSAWTEISGIPAKQNHHLTNRRTQVPSNALFDTFITERMGSIRGT